MQHLPSKFQPRSRWTGHTKEMICVVLHWKYTLASTFDVYQIPSHPISALRGVRRRIARRHGSIRDYEQ